MEWVWRTVIWAGYETRHEADVNKKAMGALMGYKPDSPRSTVACFAAQPFNISVNGNFYKELAEIVMKKTPKGIEQRVIMLMVMTASATKLLINNNTVSTFYT